MEGNVNRRQLLGGSVAFAAGCMCTSRLLAAVGKTPSEWTPLFNGKSLDDWTFYQEGIGATDIHKAVAIEDGVLHFLGPSYAHDDAPPGRISTKREWGNYHLRVDYRWGKRRWPPRKLQRRNSGILYHMGPERDRLFPECIEFQVEEGDVGDAVMVDTMALQGPLLGGTPLWPSWIEALPSTYQEPIRAGGYARQWHRHSGPYEKLDDWNTLDLIAFRDQAAHLVNGRIVNTLFKMLQSGGKAPLTKGRIALELEWAEIYFRNVLIRPLSESSVDLFLKQGSD